MSIFFFNDTATTEIYTLSLHDALPICARSVCSRACTTRRCRPSAARRSTAASGGATTSSVGDASTPALRSEEHTSELQSQSNIVCRLLLEKKSRHLYFLCR